jgi:hypothetical protein
MKAMPVPMIRTGLATLAAIALAACGGGHTAPSIVPVTSGPPSSGTAAGPLANATFQISVPNSGATATASAKRRVQYVSQATRSIKVALTTPNIGTQGTTIINVTVPSAQCIVDPSNAGNYLCTASVQVPPGTDIFTVTTFDAVGATGNVLSMQTPTLVVVAGQANTLTMTLDANAATLALVASGNCQSGAVGSAYGTVGTIPSSFVATYTDLAGKTIAGPGLPVLAILGNDAAYHTTSGSINATGGTLGFTINQATQTFTLTPSNSATTNAIVSVHATPASTSDGLAFTVAQSFTYSTGPAPPAHNFLAAVEQFGAGSGAVDFYNVTLGGSGGADSLSAFSPATLAVTSSSNEGKPDVDNPLALAWDNIGDLLIGNGGTGTGSPVDNGSLACVPLGSIATGTNSASTVSTNVDNPVSVAYDSRDGSVALANNPVGAPAQLAEYLLTGNYTAAGSPRNLIASGYGNNGVVGIPALTAGTYAAALTDGLETDPAHLGTGRSKIAILAPTGVETDITDTTTFAIDNPHAIAWDAQNNQLAIANFSQFHELLSFYTVSPAMQVKTINTAMRNYAVAASADGHIAVAGNGAFGAPQVKVYDNTGARNPVGGPIPFNGTTTSCGSTYIYANAVVNAMTWLSNTKLLIALQSFSGTATPQNGLYVFDIGATAIPAGFDDVSCSAFTAAPQQTGFVHLANKPLGAAFKP